jgi:site-specific DNA-methyltransferase (adenine-specific)
MDKYIYRADFRDGLQRIDNIRMVFADPPDSIGLKYRGFKDSIKNYEKLIRDIFTFSLVKTDYLWLSVNPIYTDLLGYLTYDYVKKYYPDFEFKPCIQVFTFGQHNHNDLGIGHRLLYRYKRKDARLYPDAVRVPSWRQLNGDPRADERGKVPSDIFDFPRVTGNSKQRRSFSPTQLHEGLYERCIKLCCKEGDKVVDLFAGSGTLGRVADNCGVEAHMIEISAEVCKEISDDQGVPIV